MALLLLHLPSRVPPSSSRTGAHVPVVPLVELLPLVSCVEFLATLRLAVIVVFSDIFWVLATTARAMSVKST